MLVKKIEVKLNKTQQNQFFVDQNNLRFMHNFYLSYQDLNYEMYRLGNSDLKYISAYEFMKLFNNEILKLNPDLNFIKNTNSKAVKQVVINLDKTFKKFFKNQSGFPKYKKKSNTWKVAIQERSFHTFKQRLINKCSKVGKTLFLANTFYPSSKTCSSCGSLKKDLKLRDRIYKCINCGQEIDRDLNASINLSYIGGYTENLSLV